MDVKNVHHLVSTEVAMETLATYKTGSACNLCFSYGLQNYLKTFYISLDEQIIKCESSRCMFPYSRKPVHHNSFPDSKPSDSTLNLDEFLEENAKQIGETPPKIEPNHCTTKEEDNPILFDFSSLFTSESPIEDQKQIPLAPAENPWKTEDFKPGAVIQNEQLLPQSQPPPKARISRCLADVKSNRSQNLKRQSKPKRGKNNPVLVIEPHSGKSMRPLDVIRQYVKF